MEATDAPDDAGMITAIFGNVIESLPDSATVERVYGEPISADGTTVVPVAKVAYGFGGGFGIGSDGDDGSGAGGGGGVSATPVGALEVDADGTRFVRFDPERRRMWLVVLIGAAIGYLLGRRGSAGPT